ncbi:hypothetical protein L9F63_014555, partial [Diploptera punctata]
GGVRRKCEIRGEADGKEPKDLTASRAMFPTTQIKMRLLSPSSSPATSPTMSNSSSPTPPALNYNHKITGIPCVAAASRSRRPSKSNFILVGMMFTRPDDSDNQFSRSWLFGVIVPRFICSTRVSLYGRASSGLTHQAEKHNQKSTSNDMVDTRCEERSLSKTTRYQFYRQCVIVNHTECFINVHEFHTSGQDLYVLVFLS